MATEKKEKETVTGLDAATNRQDAEYDLVSSLLRAAEFKKEEENIETVDIKTKSGELLFTVHVHPIGDPENRQARRKATTYAPHPNGAKFGRIEKDFDNAKYGNWVIYLASTEADQQQIWGNPAIMQKYGIMEPAESVDVLLPLGAKRKLLDLITEISGINEDDEQMDEETFQ